LSLDDARDDACVALRRCWPLSSIHMKDLQIGTRLVTGMEADDDTMDAEADAAAAKSNSKHVKVSGQDFDLGALLGMSNLQEMLRTLAGTLLTMQRDNEQLQKEVAAIKAAGEQREEKLEAMIAEKANDVRVEAIALAFETFREEQRKARDGSESVVGRILFEQKEVRSQMDHFDDEILEIRRGLTKKIDKVVFEDLLARAAHFATKDALTECEARISQVIEQVEDGSKERSRRQESMSQDHTERLRDLERELPTLQSAVAAARERSALEESIRAAAVAEKERRACWPPPSRHVHASIHARSCLAEPRCACPLACTSARPSLARTCTPPCGVMLRHRDLVARLDDFMSEAHAQASEVDRTKNIHWKHIIKCVLGRLHTSCYRSARVPSRSLLSFPSLCP
jgi:hypothetical protein